jgi:anthranilate phosphoribosyltransferase
MIEKYISRLSCGEDLTIAESEELCQLILSGSMADEEIARILILLAEKGETTKEIVGFVNVLSRSAERVEFDGATTDLCGTGGSGHSRFNVSTAAAFVVSCLNVTVAKHGNKGSRRPNGSFDLLEELDIPINLDGEIIGDCLREVGLGFIYARRFHPIMRKVVNARKMANRRTIFNLAAPLCNPTDVKYQVVGTAHQSKLYVLAETCRLLGRKKSLVVWGAPGIDEISISGVTKIVEVTEIGTREWEVSPSDFGIDLVDYSRIPGGDAKDNATVFRRLLDGTDNKEIKTLVALSSALVLSCTGFAPDLKSGYELAIEAILGGSMKRKFEEYKRFAISKAAIS